MTDMHGGLQRSAVVLDPHPVCREGLRTILAPLGIDVAAACGTPAAALRLVGEHAPSLLVAELETPSGAGEGLRLIREARASDPDLAIVVLSAIAERRRVAAAFAAGATAYLSKHADPAEIAAEVERAVAPPIYVARDVPAVLRHGERSPSAARSVPHLTPRELEVLRLVGDGKPNKEIAAQLGISEPTARRHVSNILAKLGLSSRTQAALWAVREGLVDAAPHA
jgi:DNA-binding NarL/FixJ family response regulator